MNQIGLNLALSLTLGLVLAPSATPLGGSDVDFDEVLQAACESYGIDFEELGLWDVDRLISSEHFLKVELGPFDLRLPVRDVLQNAEASLVREAARDMLGTLKTWSHWYFADSELGTQSRSDVEELDAWVKGWSSRSFKQASRTDGNDLFDRMRSADEDVQAAGQRLIETFSPRVDTEHPGRAALLVLAPSRKSFVELLTLAGEFETDRKKVLWTSEAVFNAANWSKKAQFVALRFAAWPWDQSLIYQGQSMNMIHKTGRNQHVVDRAAAALTRANFNMFASPTLEESLRTNLVIEVVGDNSLTFGIETFQWSRAGGSTQPFSRFVPGGNSAGGTLPARAASGGAGSQKVTTKSEWRKNDGKDHFRDALKKGQRAGAKLASRSRDLSATLKKDKRAHFRISAKIKGRGRLMSAPFLGDEAADKPTPPDEYIDDYEEFFRAYRAGFFYWLRMEGHPDGEDASPPAFARLLQRARSRSKTDTLSTMVKEVYGISLSGIDGETDSLEWRFLAVIAE